MKPFGYLATAVAAVALATFVFAGRNSPATAEPPRQGWMKGFSLNVPPRDAPGMTFRRGDGKTFRMADFRGRVVLVNFWATWCAPCVRELPTLDRLAATLGGPDFAVIAINEDRGGAGVAGPFLEKKGLRNLVLYLDERMSLALKFGLKQLPTSYLLDRQGRIVGELTGHANWDSPEAKALIEYYLARRV
jgi:thiol-disulfide isomerase/thioredoxin